MWLGLVLWPCALLPSIAAAMRADRQAQLRRETVDMFYHGYSNYMHHAFPEDELRPLSCGPLTRDRSNPARIGLNDALGNYSLTLIDSFSTLAILAGGPQDGSYTGPQALSDFQGGIAQFVRYYGTGRPGPSGLGIRARGFDLDSKVQVFETVIRGVGGLLSAHLFAIGELPIPGYRPKPTAGAAAGHDPLELAPIPWPNGFTYDGQLLRLALDLAQRLLPAFFTPTGIPYPRVNLRSGIPFYVNSPLHRASGSAVEPDESREITETCSAGAGSLTLEFTVLSRLTGDARFEQAAKRAFWEVWGRRSEIGLIGNGIDAEHGVWIGPHAGIGAGMDSFFEYALKSHILLSGHDVANATAARRPDRLDPNTLHGPLPAELHSSEAFLQAWHEAHASVRRHLYTDRSHYPYYANSHRATGHPYTMWIDSLGAFYPGLLALAGEVDEAIEANLVYTALWTRYAALPERWSIRENNVEAGIGWWPGRPEFIESTYHIYRATGDPWYLHVGEMVLKDIRRRCHAPCGWAGLQDVRTGEQVDRMESFFLGETTKYMYLLFDGRHPLNRLDAAYVFTTEGHPLVLPTRGRPPAPRRAPGAGGGGKQVAVYRTADAGFASTCPAPQPPAAFGLAGSATAARPRLFGASHLTDLFNTPNMHGPVEAVVDEAEAGTGRTTRYCALSNHSLFPWTLPPSMLPARGTCEAPARRVVTAIEFSARHAASALASRLGAALSWYANAGPVVASLEGLRLQLEREQPAADGPVWRITHVGATQLGRHEFVFLYAELVRHLRDEAFSCVRRQDAVQMELLVGVEPAADGDGANATSAAPAQSPGPDPGDAAAAPPEAPSDALVTHWFRALSAVFDQRQRQQRRRQQQPPQPPPRTPVPGATGASAHAASSEPAPPPRASLLSLLAHAALGPGAVPLPSLRDTPIPGAPGYDAARPRANFPWTTVFLAGHACRAPLPDAAPRRHQLIVVRRGGCSFLQKLNNIPSFSAGPQALQLVVVVDERDGQSDGDNGDGDDDDDSGLDRPLLAAEQLTPRGSKRLHGVPMVLVRGRRGAYQRFGAALAAGMRRKYVVQSQGLLIANAIVI